MVGQFLHETSVLSSLGYKVYSLCKYLLVQLHPIYFVINQSAEGVEDYRRSNCENAKCRAPKYYAGSVLHFQMVAKFTDPELWRNKRHPVAITYLTNQR